MSDYDVVVIGGGMVGAAAACLFAATHRRVAVIESAVPPVVIDDGRIDLRVSALSRASQELLTGLDAWSLIDAAARCAYREMKVWDAQVPAASDQVLHFDSAEIGEPDLGHIVENRRIVAALHERMSDHANIDVHAPVSAESIRFDDRRAQVMLGDGRSLQAGLIIGADGGNSRTRAQAGIETRGWSYEQRAVVTHVGTALPHRETAYQRFLPAGPVALLPLYDGRSSVVWSTTDEEAQRLLALSEAQFCQALCEATDGVLGDIAACDARASFPLQLQHARDYVRGRLVLIGDAAHTVHPLAGQGVNLGFADALELHRAVAGSGDAGELAGLRRYERAAKSRNLLMMSSLDALHRLFTHGHPLAARLRSAGLGLVNRLEPIKRTLIRRALGA